MALTFPDQTELLDSVIEFLRGDVAAAIDDPALSYHLKVAINSLRIVARESEHAATLEGVEQEKLSLLAGVRGSSEELNARVCQALRDGSLDATQSEVLGALKAVALAKMAIDNPRYSTYQALRPSE